MNQKIKNLDKKIQRTIAASLKAERDWLRSINAPVKRLPNNVAQAVATRMLFQGMPVELRQQLVEEIEAEKRNKAGAQLEPQQGYSILAEAAQIASQHDLDKPDSVSDRDWAAASPEAKQLSKEIEPLVPRVENAYWEAVRERDWERALLLYQRLVFPPRLWTSRGIYDDQVCDEYEAEFIARAREWIGEVEGLLG